MILISKVAELDPVIEQLDVGTGISVVIGTVALGFGVGFVRQRTYLAWYGMALLLGILPFVSELIVTSMSAGDRTVPLCPLSVPVGLDGCNLAWFPSLIFMTAVGTASKLVTEEIAFRRLLIGGAEGSGLASILFSSLIALAWYLVLSRSGVGETGYVVAGALGAVSAGCIYVLSRSLAASALFSAVYAAGNVTLALATTPGGAIAEVEAVSLTTISVASAMSLLLAAAVGRKYGFLGNLKRATSGNVISS
jgi:hypothetical protein